MGVTTTQRAYLSLLDGMYIKGGNTFSQIISVERERFRLSVDLSEYFVVFIDDSTFQNDFVDPNTIPIHGIRCTFNPQTNTLIVKIMTPEHQQVAQAINSVIYDVLIPMGLQHDILSYAEVNINVKGMSKQPDWALGPRHPPPGTAKRPRVVAEIAISQTRRRLQRDIDLWLDPSRGKVNVAIAIKASRTRPLITIDKYEWNHDNGQAQLSQNIEIRESHAGDEVRVSGGPLTIPFDHLFLRPPQSPREGDLILGREELEEIAKWVWEAQFAQF